MPTYDYRCDSCGYQFERFHSITARPARTCPQCQRRALRRLIGSGGGIIFKGSGFYQTDYRSESYRKAAEAEKSAAPDAGTKPDEGASAKPAPAKAGTTGAARSARRRASAAE